MISPKWFFFKLKSMFHKLQCSLKGSFSRYFNVEKTEKRGINSLFLQNKEDRMETISTQNSYQVQLLKSVSLALLGCGLIILCSSVRIPFFPVPFTLQTFAISFLALTQSPKQAAGSVICYLLCATLGLPVFGGHANSLWIVGTCGGYLIAFPIAAYLIAKLAQRSSVFLAVLCGQTVILFLGMLWLIPLFGISVALMKGVVFFIPSDSLKNLVAIGVVKGWKRWRNS